MERLVVGSDHSGFRLKNDVLPLFPRLGWEVLDVGCHSEERVKFPPLARKIGEAIKRGEARRGIMFCGTGIGAAMGLNRIPGIRAAVVHDAYSAHQGVEHDDMNVICLGGKIVGAWLAEEIIRAFLAASFSPEEFFVSRTRELDEMELEAARELLPQLKARGWA